MKKLLVLVCLYLSACATVEPKGTILVNETQLKELVGVRLQQEQIMGEMLKELEDLREFKDSMFF